MKTSVSEPAAAGTKRHVSELLEQVRSLHRRELEFARKCERADVAERSLHRLGLLSDLVDELELAVSGGRVLVVVREVPAHG